MPGIVNKTINAIKKPFSKKKKDKEDVSTDVNADVAQENEAQQNGDAETKAEPAAAEAPATNTVVAETNGVAPAACHDDIPTADGVPAAE